MTQITNERRRLVLFSGAGMSAESGISTFRDSGGLWENYAIEDVATPQAFRKNPALVQSFYNQRRKQIIETQPNAAHSIIKELEADFDVVVITQNIDDLHERAGSKNVIHLHGNIRFAKSSGPNQEKKYYPIEGWELKKSDKCEDDYPLRPHVVWFGEEVPMIEIAAQEIRKADILIVIGTSLNVYPAAGLIHATNENCTKVLIDPNAGNMTIPNEFEIIADLASEGLKKWKMKNE
jgi:NAD-dependent deacetylase